MFSFQKLLQPAVVTVMMLVPFPASAVEVSVSFPAEVEPADRRTDGSSS